MIKTRLCTRNKADVTWIQFTLCWANLNLNFNVITRNPPILEARANRKRTNGLWPCLSHTQLLIIPISIQQWGFSAPQSTILVTHSQQVKAKSYHTRMGNNHLILLHICNAEILSDCCLRRITFRNNIWAIPKASLFTFKCK